ncbi:hypothetical protein [Melittangium boletus]|uniref:hypothetical protein n=1 Tax=Melittangium boletus TaxID=83453 RepID=UPI0012FE6373|nr:hypothetical protein [Melittangium boletus]
MGEFLLGRPCEEVGPELGHLYEARNEATGNAGLVLLPGTRVDWDLEDDWAVRISGKRTPSSVVKVEVERAPASGRMTKLVDILALVFASLKRVEDNERVNIHLTGRPKRANWAGRFPWRLAARDGGALAGLVLILLLCLSFTSQSESEEQSASGMTCETRGQVDAAQMIDAAEAGVPPIAYRMPDKPFRNQATPPCTPNRDEEEINGGCWVQLARKPPCLGETQAEYQGKCYLPVAKRTPPLQSVEP